MTASTDSVPAPAGRKRWQGGLAHAAASLAQAAAHAPEIASYGLMAMAPLGAAFAPQAMALALIGTIVANLVADALGAGRLIGGPRASMALLTAGFVAGITGGDAPAGEAVRAAVLAAVTLGISAAALLQAAFGLLGFGSLLKYVPHPVHVGLTSGVGVLLMAVALPAVLGHSLRSGLHEALADPHFGDALVGAAALTATGLVARLRRGPPPVLVGLLLATLLSLALGHWIAPGALGPSVGAPELPAFDATRLADLPGALGEATLLAPLGSFALAVALMATLDTLLTSSVVDGRMRQRRDANRELVVQGLANLASAGLGGHANSPSIARSLPVVAAMPAARHAVTGYALALLAVLTLAPQLLGMVPRAAIGGVLLIQGAQMVSPTLWRIPLALWAGGEPSASRPRYDEGQRLVLAENWGVTLVVTVSAIAFGLAPAVLIGASFAIVLFVRSSMRDVVRRMWSGQNRHSLKMRPAAAVECLQCHGDAIAVLELEGSLFFGTAEALRARLESVAARADTAILDVHQVGEIDVTAARILLETGEDWARRGKLLVVAEWAPSDPRRRTIEAMAAPAHAAALEFAADTDQALESAEDRLLLRLAGDDGGKGRILELGETMLGRGLDHAEIELLAPLMQQQRFAAGELLFRVGDPGDAIYISLEGHIGLRLPGSTRRLASFAPGVVMGEMAVLAHRTRSAEAFAETDLLVLHLPAEAFDRLRLDHPALAAKLLHQISLHLAERVRVLTGDLASWVARAAVDRRVDRKARRGRG